MSDITVRKVLATLGWKVDDAQLKAANKEIDKTKKEVAATDKEVRQLEGHFGKAATAAELGFGKAGRAAKVFGDQAERASSGIGKALGKLSGALNVNMLMGFAKGASAYLSEASDRMGELGAAANVLPGGIDHARAATQGLLSDFELTTAGAAAFRAEIVTGGKDFGKYARDVARLAMASGDQVGTSVKRMTDELASGSTALLEQYGITLDAEKAVQTYAASQNKLAEDLSDSEKQQVVVAEAMRLISERAAEVGDTLTGTTAEIQRSKAELENLSDTMKGGVVAAADGAVAGMGRLGTGIGTVNTETNQLLFPLQDLEQRLISVQAQMKGLADESIETAAQLSMSAESLDEFYRVQALARGKSARDSFLEGKRRENDERVAGQPKTANILDQDGNVVGTYRDQSGEQYQKSEAELRAEKRREAEIKAHEEEAAYQRMFGGLEVAPKKTKGAKKPGDEFFFNRRDLSGLADDDVVGALLAASGYRPGGKTQKDKALDEVYRDLRKTSGKSIAAHLEPAGSPAGKHFMDLLTSGSPAGDGLGSAGGAQGLGTRIINIDARIDADINVVAPEGLVGAGEVEARRVSQDVGRGIAAELDPYFTDQATVIRRAVEG